MYVIGIAGAAGSGKTALREKLLERLTARRCAYASYADIIRDITAKCSLVDEYLLDTQSGKRTRLANGLTVRELMCRYGAALRAVEPDALVNAMTTRLATKLVRSVIIDDVRMVNEAQQVLAFGDLVYLPPRGPVNFDEATESQFREIYTLPGVILPGAVEGEDEMLERVYGLLRLSEKFKTEMRA